MKSTKPIDTSLSPLRTLVVGLYRSAQERSSCLEHLDELISLLETHGSCVVDQISAPLRRIHPATLLARGKLEEIATAAKAQNCESIAFDEELTPPQQRNLEAYFGLPVIDRTEVILRVFDSRAQTKEARLQVELAKAEYEAPRLIKLWSHLSRQRGGGINQRGEGEAQLEVDRRLLRRRVQALKTQLRAVERGRLLRNARRARTAIPEIAIIGYTNAGKSTLMNLLTRAGVFVEDKLFATLDTTTRQLILPNRQRVLLTDTVGFLRKLPHQLVAAFRSTLEQSLRADLLLHLVDAAHPNALPQIQATEEVLKSLGALHKPRIIALNKIDQASPDQVIGLRLRSGSSVGISALEGQGIDELLAQLMAGLSKERADVDFEIPIAEMARIDALKRQGAELNIEFCGDIVRAQGQVPIRLVDTLTPYFVSERAPKGEIGDASAGATNSP